MIAQTLPSWEQLASLPYVKQLIIFYIILRLIEYLFTPLSIKIIKSLGLLKQTWRESMDDKMKKVADLSADTAQNVSPDLPNIVLDPAKILDVKKIGDA